MRQCAPSNSTTDIREESRSSQGPVSVRSRNAAGGRRRARVTAVRIEDQDRGELKGVYIWLTPEEASEMVDALRQLIDDPKDRHEHVSARSWLETGDPELAREITLSIARD
jgi:hypothetical protein